MPDFQRLWRPVAPAIALFVGASVYLSQPEPAAAHPHAWIYMKTVLVFDSQGRALGLRQHWSLDEFYSAYSIEGLDVDEDGVINEEELAKLRAEQKESLTEHEFLTRVEVAGEKVAFAAVEDMNSRLVEGQLEITFYLPFDAPQELGGESRLVYAVFDPTYWIEMLHAPGPEKISLVDAPESCGFRLVLPDPNAETMALAAALDRNETAGDTLGIAFAEKVEVTCGP
jgi:ABC-type uncharacterized transport system substrate-binding protein